jgi:hypothetical protein
VDVKAKPGKSGIHELLKPSHQILPRTKSCLCENFEEMFNTFSKQSPALSCS